MGRLEAFSRLLARDLPASLVVFLVALPLCMGIAIASGVPPEKGLLTGIIGGLIVGMLAGSPLQVSGPAAGLAVIVVELVRQHGPGMLGPVLLVAGALQILAGGLRLGQWFRAISPALVHGMLAGIGILIVLAQFHVMLDAKPQPSGLANLQAIPDALANAFVPPSVPPAGGGPAMAGTVGLATILAMLAWDRLKPAPLRLVPGALVGVMAGAILAAASGWPIQHVATAANLMDAVTWPAWRDLARLGEPDILVSCCVVALIASTETLLSAAAVDRMHTGPRSRFNRELAAQGIGNMLCGLIGALPMTGVIVRSSANVQAGAVSRASTILHGLWLLVLVALLPGLLHLVPTAALAGVLVITGWRLVSVQHVRSLAKYGAAPVAIYLVTVLVIVTTDLLTGVLVGLVLTILQVLLKATRLQVRLAGDPQANEVALELHGAATFIGLPQLARTLDAVPAGAALRLKIDRLTYIDHTCLELLEDWAHQSAAKGCRLIVDWTALKERYRAAGALAVP